MITQTRPPRRKWQKLSFASTLHLHPVVDLLVANLPGDHSDEVRLGLQEALVNAAKHGNSLDPSKRVVVRHAHAGKHYWWVVCDQGHGFNPPVTCDEVPAFELDNPEDSSDLIFNEDNPAALPICDSACGRGLFILHHVFDQVAWSDCGRELHLYKHVNVDSVWGIKPILATAATHWGSLADRLRSQYEVLFNVPDSKFSRASISDNSESSEIAKEFPNSKPSNSGKPNS
ncbi:MAG: ATP-binding protein [Cyanophyceae cyanobacterium]